jgi:hypothetical protein
LRCQFTYWPLMAYAPTENASVLSSHNQRPSLRESEPPIHTRSKPRARATAFTASFWADEWIDTSWPPHLSQNDLLSVHVREWPSMTSGWSGGYGGGGDGGGGSEGGGGGERLSWGTDAVARIWTHCDVVIVGSWYAPLKLSFLQQLMEYGLLRCTHWATSTSVTKPAAGSVDG